MTRVLLSGFEPFAEAAVNPSWDAVEVLARDWSGPAELRTVRLPVVFGAAADRLREAVQAVDPQLVIAVGLAEGRAAVTPERIGVNLDDARIPDNAGARPLDAPIEPHGPAARFSTLPVKAIVAALQAAGIPAAVSGTAGSFVCNHVLYRLQGELEGRPGVRGGFVHVPATPELGAPEGTPTLTLEQLAEALRLAVEVSLAHERDLPLPGGEIS